MSAIKWLVFCPAFLVLTQLVHKASVGHDEAFALDMLERLFHVTLQSVHGVGNHDGGRSADACAAVHQDSPALRDCLFNESIRVLQMVQEILLLHVSHSNRLVHNVVSRAHKSVFEVLGHIQNVRDVVVLEESKIAGSRVVS